MIYSVKKALLVLLFFNPVNCMELSKKNNNVTQEELDQKLFLIKNTSLEELETLLDLGANPNTKNGLGNSPLGSALFCKYFFNQDTDAKIKLLLKAGAHLHGIATCELPKTIPLDNIVYDETAFHSAVEQNDLELCKLFIQHAQKSDEEIEKMFKTAEALFLIRKAAPTALPLPKEIVFLILNHMQNSVKFPTNKSTYPNLRTILGKKQYAPYVPANHQKTAFEIANNNLHTAHNELKEYIKKELNPYGYEELSFDIQKILIKFGSHNLKNTEDIPAFYIRKARIETITKIKNLVDPNNY